MFKITMQDGNIVYTNLKSIKMLSKYQKCFDKTKGQSVCLVLDSTHSTIEKVNCDDLNSKQKVEEKTGREDGKRPKRLKQQMKKLWKIPRFKKNNDQQKMNLGIRLNGFMMITQACIIMKTLEVL